MSRSAILSTGAVALLAVGLILLFVENVSLRSEVRSALREAYEARYVSSEAHSMSLVKRGFGNASGATPIRVPEIDFGCTVPAEQRLTAECWITGMRGKYKGKMVKRFAHENMELGRSQNTEDLHLLQRYFFGRRGGTFLEMGALDGETYSNSWYFEKELGWRGLLIEGSPKNYAALAAKRPGAVNINAMVCSEERQLHWVNGISTAVGGAWELMQPDFRRSKHPKMTDDMVKKLPTVPCIRLDRILARFGVRHVDLFSLDVEGAEESVLKTINFDNFSASVILVEVRRGSTGIVEHLGKNNYVQDKKIGNNLVFLHPRFRASIQGDFSY